MKTFFAGKFLKFFLCLALILLIYKIMYKNGRKYRNAHQHIKNLPTSLFGRDQDENFLDGCYHVYLDVGSNVGIQVRKVYEPKLYRHARVNDLYNYYFGMVGERKLDRICSVGFEPNPAHTDRLTELENAYNKCGWRIKFYKETGVEAYNGYADLFTDNNQRRLNWGMSLFKEKKSNRGTTGQVKVMRLTDFVLDYVATRKVPQPILEEEPPQVFMKLDTEGSELSIIPDMLLSGAFQYITGAILELHEGKFQNEKHENQTRYIRDFLPLLEEYTNRISFYELEDERYAQSNFSLPVC